jgi:Fe-S oxidoreductase
MRKNLQRLAPLARQGLTIVVPEPSCASAFRDEMPDLLTGAGERDDARLVASSVATLDEFLADLPDGALGLRAGPANALLHVHCHQRAHAGTAPSIDALRRVPGLDVHEPDAGCCGMAGAFGYQSETYAASIAMAERRLAPSIRSAGDHTVIVAPGASCRQQIAHTTGRTARHPAELLAACLPDEAAVGPWHEDRRSGRA